jgi:hypothetical protein
MLYFLSSDFFATCSSFCCCCSQCRIELTILIFILFITSLDRSADRIPFYYLTRGTDRFRLRFRFHHHAQLSQGQLLKMHLLESQLFDTFMKNVICSTQKTVKAVDKMFVTVKNKSSFFFI